ncbi:hypothetical protein BH20ACT15_BH20ACT15_09520 [soil metagenome]
MTEALQVAGCIAAAACVAAAMLSNGRRVRAALLIAALALALALITGEAWDELTSLRERPALFAAAVVAAALATVALALLLRRYPVALPLLLIAALPFRVPIGVGTEDANLLLPLYAVIAAGALAAAISAYERGGERFGAEPRPLAIALAASVLLYALQSVYSEDIGFATRNVAFFLVPFAAMFALLSDVDWNPRLLKWSLAVIVAEGVVFALVGAVQYAAGEIFWNPALMLSNDFHFYFRVNSLFWDPNIYGRYLALVAAIVAAGVLWARRPREVGAGALVLAVLLGGLVLGFSQTSFIALLVGIGVVAGLRYSAAGAAVGLPVVIAVALAAVVFVGGTSEAEDSPEEVSSGRSTLIEGGVELFTSQPLIGNGSASFPVSFAKQEDLNPNKPAISHNEAVTVAAEQGMIGLLAYAAVIMASILALLSGMRRFAPGLGAGPDAIGDPRGDPGGRILARIALAGAFAAMLVHTAGYGAFLTDPLTWAILAIGGSLAARDASPT